MYLRRIFIYLLINLFIIASYAQTAAEGENLFNNRQYSKAKEVYAALLKRSPKDVLYNYRYARCCYELKDFESATRHFVLAGNRYPLTNLYLGDSYFHTYRFEAALEAYQNYLSSLNDDKTDEINEKIKKAEIGEKLLKRVEDIAIIDSMVVNKNEFISFYKLSHESGTLTQERIKLGNKQIFDKVAYTTERGDRTYFSDSIRGKMQLFSSHKLFDEWSRPAVLSNNIHPQANKNYPFLLLDGLTLFYSTDGEGSIGGCDIFYTRYSPTTQDFLLPENVGFPFNSLANDYMMAYDDLQQAGWFASDRYQPEGKVVIYRFKIENPKKYIKTEDEEALRLAAMMAKYRKANINTATSTKPSAPNKPKEATNAFHLVINDSTAYTQYEEFQSMKALNIFKEYIKLKDGHERLITTLENLRTDYALAENEKTLKQVGDSIISMEKTWIENEKLIKTKLYEASNEEILFLNKN